MEKWKEDIRSKSEELRKKKEEERRKVFEEMRQAEEEIKRIAAENTRASMQLKQPEIAAEGSKDANVPINPLRAEALGLKHSEGHQDSEDAQVHFNIPEATDETQDFFAAMFAEEDPDDDLFHELFDVEAEEKKKKKEERKQRKADEKRRLKEKKRREKERKRREKARRKERKRRRREKRLQEKLKMIREGNCTIPELITEKIKMEKIKGVDPKSQRKIEGMIRKKMRSTALAEKDRKKLSKVPKVDPWLLNPRKYQRSRGHDGMEIDSSKFNPSAQMQAGYIIPGEFQDGQPMEVTMEQQHDLHGQPMEMSPQQQDHTEVQNMDMALQRQYDLHDQLMGELVAQRQQQHGNDPPVMEIVAHKKSGSAEDEKPVVPVGEAEHEGHFDDQDLAEAIRLSLLEEQEKQASAREPGIMGTKGQMPYGQPAHTEDPAYSYDQNQRPVKRTADYPQQQQQQPIGMDLPPYGDNLPNTENAMEPQQMKRRTTPQHGKTASRSRKPASQKSAKRGFFGIFKKKKMMQNESSMTRSQIFLRVGARSMTLRNLDLL
jgi:hypothetical protein